MRSLCLAALTLARIEHLGRLLVWLGCRSRPQTIWVPEQGGLLDALSEVRLQNARSHQFCGDWGRGLSNSGPKCGADNPADKKFCRKCGASLAPEGHRLKQVPPVVAAENSNPRKIRGASGAGSNRPKVPTPVSSRDRIAKVQLSVRRTAS